MKKLLLNIFLLIICMPLAKAHNYLIGDSINLGTNLTNNLIIKGKVYNFKTNYLNIEIDSLTQKIFVLTQATNRKGKTVDSKGHIYILNLENNSECWNRPIDFKTEACYYTPQGIIISKSWNEHFILNLNDGSCEWSERFILKGTFNDCLLGFRISTLARETNILECRYLKSGEIKWETKLKYKYLWDSHYLIDNSKLLISADGIHLLDINNGLGWHRTTITETELYERGIPLNRADKITPDITEFGYYQTGPSSTNGVVSNILRENNRLYQASHDSIVCLNLAGETIWKSKIPGKNAYNTKLFFYDNKVFLINLGHGFRNNNPDRTGQPFLSCYEKETGTITGLYPVNTSKSSIRAFLLTSENLNIAFDDQIVRIDFKNPEKNKYFAWNDKTGKKIEGFSEKPIYLLKNNKIVKSEFPSECYLFNQENVCYFIHPETGESAKVTAQNTYIEQTRWKNFTILYSLSNNHVMIDSKGNKVADLRFDRLFSIYQDRLYASLNHLLVEIDLTQLLEM